MENPGHEFSLFLPTFLPLADNGRGGDTRRVCPEVALLQRPFPPESEPYKSHCPEEVCTVRVTKPDARPGPRRPPLRPSPGSAPDPAARSPARHPSLQSQSLPSPKATSPLNRPSVKPLLKRDQMLCSSAILQEDSGLKHSVPRALSGRPHVTVTRVPSPGPSLRSQTDPRGHVTCPQARHPKPAVCAAPGEGTAAPPRAGAATRC